MTRPSTRIIACVLGFLLSAAVLVTVFGRLSRVLLAQNGPAAKKPPQAKEKAVAGPSVGETCSVSPTATLLAGRPDEPQAAATNKWGKKLLNVTFFDGRDPWNLLVRQKVQDFVKEWEIYANVQFTFNSATHGDIVIQLERSSKYPKYGIYQSLYGPNAANEATYDRPSMWLLFEPNICDSKIKRATLHEFGHALGLIHEQTRPDSGIKWYNDDKQVYKYYAYTGWSENQIDAQVINPFAGKLIRVTPFDRSSIMIYPIPKGLANLVVDWNMDLSPMDKLFMGVLYPSDAGQTAFKPLKLGDPPLNDKIDVPDTLVRYRFSVSADGRYVIKTSGPTPLLIGLFGSAHIETPEKVAAVEGANARIEADLQANNPNSSGLAPGTYYLYVRHQVPKTGTGPYSVALSKE